MIYAVLHVLLLYYTKSIPQQACFSGSLLAEISQEVRANHFAQHLLFHT